MLQGRLYIVTDQGPDTGIGIYADALRSLLQDSFAEVNVLSLCYLPVEERPGWVRLPGSRTARSVYEIPLALRHNHRLMISQLDSQSWVHFCGASYSALPHFPFAIATVHDYYARRLDWRSVRDPRNFLRDVAANVAFVTVPRRVRSARKRIVPSRVVQYRLMRGSSLPSNVIHHWIQSSRFRAREMLAARATLGLPREGRLVLNVSQGTSNKNYPLMARIAARLPSDFRFVKVGGRLTAGPRVIHMRNLPHDQYPLLFNASDVYLHTSTDEGFGRPLIEAIASRLPVVALRTAISEEVLSDAGCYVEASDPVAEWIRALQRSVGGEGRTELLENLELRQREFSEGTARKLHESLYESAFAGSPS